MVQIGTGDRSASQQLWDVMFDALKNKKTEMTMDYFIGFSHALFLSGAISPNEWSKVQRFSIGEC